MKSIFSKRESRKLSSSFKKRYGLEEEEEEEGLEPNIVCMKRTKCVSLNDGYE
jgi:hypothetical protein